MENPTGELKLKFRKKTNGATYLAEQYFKLPLQIMAPHYQDEDGTAFLYLLNPSGGILQHDRLLTRVTVEDGAKVLITTPSSTKFYRMDDGHAILKNDFTVHAGGTLEYLPEYNVPFAKSKSYQINNFYLDEEAVLIASDLVTAGRISRGEAFQYNLYSSKTKIYVNGKLLAYDHGTIEPSKMKLDTLGMMEGYSSNGSIYIYKKNMMDALAEQINTMENHWEDIGFAASQVNDSLMIVRLLGQNVSELQDIMHIIWNIIREKLLGKPAVRMRKY